MHSLLAIACSTFQTVLQQTDLYVSPVYLEQGKQAALSLSELIQSDLAKQAYISIGNTDRAVQVPQPCVKKPDLVSGKTSHQTNKYANADDNIWKPSELLSEREITYSMG